MSSTTSNALLWGTIATAICSLLSVSGALIVPLLRGSSKHRWMHFFISMAVATLSSDAILHIIPQILGVHSHSHVDHHLHEDNVSNVTDGHPHDHDDHDHDHDDHDHHDHDHHHHGSERWLELTPEREMMCLLTIFLIPVFLLYVAEFIMYYRKRTPKCSIDSVHNSVKHTEEPVIFWQLTNRAIIILFGDGIHNFVDGVAIAVSFMSSTRLGLVTSIAVICHELPHELGDLAVLLDSGLSMTKALILNLLSSFTAFAGLYMGILLGYNEEAEKCLLALTGGMFLYVAWIDMLSHQKNDGFHGEDHWSAVCCLQCLGFLVGFSVIFLLGWFEHQIFS